jgi:hypothetical protein
VHRLFRIGSAAALTAAALAVFGSGVASAAPSDDDGTNSGQPGSSADSSYSSSQPDPTYQVAQTDSSYQAPPAASSDPGIPGGTTTTPANPTTGVLNGLASPGNAGSGVTPNGFSPGQSLSGGSLGGL